MDIKYLGTTLVEYFTQKNESCGLIFEDLCSVKESKLDIFVRIDSILRWYFCNPAVFVRAGLAQRIQLMYRLLVAPTLPIPGSSVT